MFPNLWNPFEILNESRHDKNLIESQTLGDVEIKYFMLGWIVQCGKGGLKKEGVHKVESLGLMECLD